MVKKSEVAETILSGHSNNMVLPQVVYYHRMDKEAIGTIRTLCPKEPGNVGVNPTRSIRPFLFGVGQWASVKTCYWRNRVKRVFNTKTGVHPNCQKFFDSSTTEESSAVQMLMNQIIKTPNKYKGIDE